MFTKGEKKFLTIGLSCIFLLCVLMFYSLYEHNKYITNTYNTMTGSNITKKQMFFVGLKEITEIEKGSYYEQKDD